MILIRLFRLQPYTCIFDYFYNFWRIFVDSFYRLTNIYLWNLIDLI